MSTQMLKDLPDLPLADGHPTFAEPWEAQAFAMVVHLHEKGAFTWTEWAAFLSEEIHGGAERSYYEHWLAALERIVARQAITTAEELDLRKAAWHEAAARTPHGEPIEL